MDLVYFQGMKVFPTVFLAMILFLCGCDGSHSKPGIAGEGWISSGGELLRDAQNPWWVKNSSTVTYCVQIDEQTISARPAKVLELVRKSIAYWKTEFSRSITLVTDADLYNLQFHYLGVGAQTFVEKACSGNEDLSFRIGYGTLSNDQIEYVHEPGKYVAAAVRTKYDEGALKGSGFIYVASDKGANRYAADPNLIESPWQYDSLLYGVLLHEVGHVFGIPHVGEEFGIMSQQFPELILNKHAGSVICNIFKKGLDYPSFFLPPSRLSYCFGSVNRAGKARVFFGMQEGSDCLYFKIDNQRMSIEVRAGTETGINTSYVGEIQSLNLHASSHPAIMLRTNQKQKVFLLPPSTFSLLSGPSFFDLSGTGIYKSQRGEERSIYLNLSSQTGSASNIAGVTDSRLEILVPSLFADLPKNIPPSTDLPCPPASE